MYEDVVSLYRTHSAVVLFDKSFSVEYAGEKAIDAGGVTRESSLPFGKVRISRNLTEVGF